MAPERNSAATERQEELLHSLEQDEEILRDAVHELAEATEQKLDFTQYIRAAPLGWLAGAFCVGLWLGMGSGDSADVLSIPSTDHRRFR